MTRRGGHRLVTFREVLAWLNTRWPSYYPPIFLAGSDEADYAAMVHDGVPVMVNVRLQARSLLDPPRLHLLLAAPLEEFRDEAPEEIGWPDQARDAGARLQELGFRAEIWASGVLLQATPDSVRQFREHGIPPGSLDQALEQGSLLVRALEK